MHEALLLNTSKDNKVHCCLFHGPQIHIVWCCTLLVGMQTWLCKILLVNSQKNPNSSNIHVYQTIMALKYNFSQIKMSKMHKFLTPSTKQHHSFSRLHSDFSLSQPLQLWSGDRMPSDSIVGAHLVRGHSNGNKRLCNGRPNWTKPRATAHYQAVVCFMRCWETPRWLYGKGLSW